LKSGNFAQAYSSILKAKQLAERDSEYEAEQARFKTQELHILNSLVECF